MALNEEAIPEILLIDKAKRLLMSNCHWDEERAYKWIRETSMNRRRRKYEIAQMIIRHYGVD